MKNPLRLFVYGSLKVGECNDHMIANFMEDWRDASTTGEMRLRPDGYPALFLSDHGVLGSDDYLKDLALQEAPFCGEGSLVRGQVLYLAPGGEALALLDPFEGYFPGKPSEYRRVALSVTTESGPEVCWTYVGVGSPQEDWPTIECWPVSESHEIPKPYHHGL